MPNARSLVRNVAAPLACALALLLPRAGSAQTIEPGLNVFVATGTWELVAKTNSGFGIEGITTYLTNINSGAVNEAPRGIVNGSNVAGFGYFNDDAYPASPPNPAYHELIIAQLPIAPLPPGNEQGLFFGVGTLDNGWPNYPGKPVGANSMGPMFTSLTNVQDVPWATGDPLGDPAWSTAARLASGTYSGVTPGFRAGSLGNVFTAATPANYGNPVSATTVNAFVRIMQSADYNHNGIVDAADYVVWRKTLGNPAVPPGSGADGNGDGTVNGPDYTLWRAHFGNPFGAGSGAGGSLSTGAVPEPAAGMLRRAHC